MTDFETHPVGTGKRLEQLEANVADLRESLLMVYEVGYRNGQQAAKAKLAEALDALQLADDNLTNLQPKIAELVPAPWTAVIDGYVDPVIKTARAAIAALKGQDDE